MTCRLLADAARPQTVFIATASLLFLTDKFNFDPEYVGIRRCVPCSH